MWEKNFYDLGYKQSCRVMKFYWGEVLCISTLLQILCTATQSELEKDYRFSHIRKSQAFTAPMASMLIDRGLIVEH